MKNASIRQMLPSALTALMFLATGAPVSACLWYYGTSVEGEGISLSGLNPDRYVRQLTDHSDHGYRRYLGYEAAKEIEPKEDYKKQSDQAANLVHDGKPKEAIVIFEEIEKSHPGEYVIAANLGTAYELSGDNQKALHWIQEGIRRNKSSHFGTEWLHVKILEAKLALEQDPDWLKSHSVLGLDFGSESSPKMPTAWPEGQTAESTVKALEYQLHERLSFVSAPDALVGQLIGDLGNLLALTKSIEHAIAVYDLALPFQPINSELIKARRAHLSWIALWGSFKSWLLPFSILGLLILLWVRSYRRRKLAAA